MALSFDEVLGFARQRLEAEAADAPSIDENCLSFAELRRWVLRPEESPRGVTEHLGSCLRCSRLAEKLSTQMPHLPWWTLLAVELGQVPPGEERSVQYHLAEGGCSLCTARLRQLTARCAVQMDSNRPHYGFAAQGLIRNPTVQAYFPDGSFEVELLQAVPQFECQIRTRDERLRYNLFAFARFPERFDDPAPQDPLVGYTVLEEETQGSYCGWISAENPRGVPGAGFQGTCVIALRPDELHEEEVHQILSVVGPTLEDAVIRERWKRWLTAQAASSTEKPQGTAHQLLRALRSSMDR